MRAFAIRFVAFAGFVLAMVPVLVLADGRGWWPWQWIAAYVVTLAAVMAVGGAVGDYRGSERRSFGVPDRRSWRDVLFGSREMRRRMRQERVFANSASAGFLHLGVALFWGLMGVTSDARFPLHYLLAAFFICLGTRQLWCGWRRWRAGGEFDYPPEATFERDAGPGA